MLVPQLTFFGLKNSWNKTHLFPEDYFYIIFLQEKYQYVRKM